MLYKLERLQRVYGDRIVLDIDFLEIAPNAIYTLIGPNGAGKTSLLKILAFLDKPSSGDLSFSGQPVRFGEKHLHTLRRRVVMLDQTPILFTGTVWKNVEFGLRIRKVPAVQRKRRVEKMLELVGMEKFRDFDSRGLSGGEVKRVALARALVLRPDVLLCDEPTANVDGENQESILHSLEQINREEKTSIIFSTHYLSQGQRLADHTLLLQHGSLSDLAGENIFRVALMPQKDDKTLCRLTEQISLLLPAERVSSCNDSAKLHIDPKLIVLDPDDKDLTHGNYLYGQIMDLAQDRGGIRIGMDAGVRLALTLSVEEYDRRQPVLGQRKLIFIPYDGVVCTSADFF
ncbi:MAG: ATP-binding cassette domain-containing protein [Deltaproteobacteria bacterium]|nr:ATP-binding cassette domain-containing protein [Deltaproteobacteria bacterium]